MSVKRVAIKQTIVSAALRIMSKTERLVFAYKNDDGLNALTSIC